MKKNKKTILIAISISVLIMLSACSQSTFSGIKVLEKGSELTNGYDYSYKWLNGSHSKPFVLDKKTKIKLNYKLQINDGSLTVQVLDDKDNIVFEKKSSETMENSTTLNLDKGKYTLKISADSSKGGFKVNYEKLN